LFQQHLYYFISDVLKETFISHFIFLLNVRTALEEGDQMRVDLIAASPYPLPKSVGAKSDFGHFQSSEQHATGCV